MKCIPNRQAKAGSKTGKSSPHPAKPTSHKKASKSESSPKNKAALKVPKTATSISPSPTKPSRANTEHIPEGFTETFPKLGPEIKSADQVDVGSCISRGFETNEFLWSCYRLEVSGLAYHLAASHTGYHNDFGEGVFHFQMRLREDLPIWEDLNSKTVSTEDGLIQGALRSSGDSDRFPADMLLRGAETMLEEYVALLASERECLRGNIDPITYPLLLGLYAIRTGGWWDNPRCDPVPEWTFVNPGHGTLIEYVWKVGPQTGASGEYGQVVDKARWKLEEMFGPKNCHNGTLLELVLMDTCRLSLARALQEAKAGVDLRERSLFWMDKFLGPNPYDQDVF